MSAIAARTGPDTAQASDQVTSMLGAMRARGGDLLDRYLNEDVALGTARFDWEAGALGTPQGIVRRGPLAVAADATLYYKDDLRRTLTQHGIAQPGNSAPELILSAYEAFGASCAKHLEGDFAFVLLDERSRRVFVARDFGGKRPLYYHVNGSTLVIASTIGGVLADVRVPRELSVSTIASVASGLWTNTAETCFRAVSEFRAGHAMTWERSRGVSIEQFWQAPTPPVSRPEAGDADHLRALLTRATEERLVSAGTTAVTLSGGWDSTAVFGAGQNALGAGAGGNRSLQPVSISYPEGDPGYEDDFITEVTTRWNTSSRWIKVDDIEMFPDAHGAARRRDEPWTHPFEQWNRALSRTARESGARVVLDGSGGDQLFQVSEVYLADLFRAGHWMELRRQWRVRGGGRGFRAFLRAAVRPALSEGTLRTLSRLRGQGEPQHYLYRRPSAWIRHSFLRAHGVLARELGERPPLPRSSNVLAELHAFLTYPYFPRVGASVASFALNEGVELRSPLLDARIVEFAASRPWHERSNGAESKILLRRSMRDLLPERLLAPRAKRTGITSGYFNRCMHNQGRAVLEPLMEDSLLAAIGLVDPGTLKRAWEYYLTSSDDEVGVRIFFTLQTELWLRVHEGVDLPGQLARTGPAMTQAS